MNRIPKKRTKNRERAVEGFKAYLKSRGPMTSMDLLRYETVFTAIRIIPTPQDQEQVTDFYYSLKPGAQRVVFKRQWLEFGGWINGIFPTKPEAWPFTDIQVCRGRGGPDTTTYHLPGDVHDAIALMASLYPAHVLYISTWDDWFEDLGTRSGMASVSDRSPRYIQLRRLGSVPDEEWEKEEVSGPRLAAFYRYPGLLPGKEQRAFLTLKEWSWNRSFLDNDGQGNKEHPFIPVRPWSLIPLTAARIRVIQTEMEKNQ